MSNKLMMAKATRQWVQEDKKIHALNYWYYRWFTNRFILYVLNSKREDLR